MDDNDPPVKRRKLDTNLSEDVLAVREKQPSLRRGLDKPISPPLSKRKSPALQGHMLSPTWGFDDVPNKSYTMAPLSSEAQEHDIGGRDSPRTKSTLYVPSPFQLTHIQDLVPRQNVDSVQLKDILGDPMIKECWNFNFLFDLDFVMKQFDDDVRDLVKVKIIHGFWKNDDQRRIALLEEAERYPNIELLHAYIPDPFGTHHSKMLVLFRHDEQAQVVIHTANMISRDWRNMTQAVWRSPMLPLCSLKTASEPPSAQNTATCQIGSGERFKIDLLRYFKAYGNRLANMTRQLKDYDFSSVRAAFIGSTPSRQKPAAAKPCEQTSFGWLGLQEVLSNVPIATNSDPTTSPPHIVMQVSSIATLGAAPTWLTQFQSALACSTSVQSPASKPAVKPMSASKFGTKDNAFNTQQDKAPHPTFNIIFPTPDEIRTSLDGYESGGSIHTKLQSQQQQKQLEYLHPLFCHWKGLSAASHSSSQAQQQRQALRGPAAPHIKTYIRFSNLEHKTIDWAMVTSANLSKQAWGDVINKKDEIWIQSWEAGVVVWPALFTEPGSVKKTVLVPMFGKDMPGPEDIPETKKITDEMGKVDDTQVVDEIIVGLRMPYDLPLRSYATKEKPWCATMQYSEPDWKGLVWGGY